MCIGICRKLPSSIRSPGQVCNATAIQVPWGRMPSLPLPLSENVTNTYNSHQNLKFSIESPRLPHTVTSYPFLATSKFYWNIPTQTSFQTNQVPLDLIKQSLSYKLYIETTLFQHSRNAGKLCGSTGSNPLRIKT